MRVAVATLADAVNVREGMMSILSAGVTAIVPLEYPTSFAMELALMIELGQQDLAQDRTIRIAVNVSDPDGGRIAEIQGELGWSASEAWPQYVPAPIALREFSISRHGRHEVVVTVGDLEPIAIVFNAREVGSSI